MPQEQEEMGEGFMNMHDIYIYGYICKMYSHISVYLLCLTFAGLGIDWPACLHGSLAAACCAGAVRPVSLPI